MEIATATATTTPGDVRVLVPRAPWAPSVAPWPVDAHPAAVSRTIVVQKSDFRAPIPAIPPACRRHATARAHDAAKPPCHHRSSSTTSPGHSERVGSTLDGSCRTRAPASDGNVEGVCESDDVPKGCAKDAHARTPRRSPSPFVAEHRPSGRPHVAVFFAKRSL